MSAILGACGGDTHDEAPAPTPDEAPRCDAPAPSAPDCAPSVEPSYPTLFTRILQPSCGIAGGTCHSAQARRGGLAFADIDESYRLLLERGTVDPDDASCSKLMERITSEQPLLRMPPAAPLSAGEQCAIATWLARGAPRD